jgi:hypothetical protein
MQRAKGARAARLHDDYLNVQRLVNADALTEASALISVLLAK